jgi:tetratricopeptide (TPR) repeat protein
MYPRIAKTEKISLRPVNGYLKKHPNESEFESRAVTGSHALAQTLVHLDDHAGAAAAIEDLFPLFTDSQQQDMNHVVTGFTSRGILMDCASLAARDAALSQVDRDQAAQAYTQRAGLWLEEATLAAERWARGYPQGPDTHAWIVVRDCETLIHRPEQDDDRIFPQQTDSTSTAELGLVLSKALIQEAVRRSPDHPTQYMLADLLSTAPEELRDADLGLALARRCVELTPGDGNYVRSLGWALYRAGDWQGAIENIGLAGGEHSDFVLAMAHWQLGDKAKARVCFDRGREWFKGHEKECQEMLQRGTLAHPTPSMLKRLEAEAAALLGVTPSSVESALLDEAAAEPTAASDNPPDAGNGPPSAGRFPVPPAWPPLQAAHPHSQRLRRDRRFAPARQELSQLLRQTPRDSRHVSVEGQSPPAVWRGRRRFDASGLARCGKRRNRVQKARRAPKAGRACPPPRARGRRGPQRPRR